jgi:cytosine/adenosine deaminase-related metal-dependent hydrolase
MTNNQSRLWRARWILPICSDPIKGGWIRIQDDRIVALGSGRPKDTAEDLGDVALLPGLVNAHTHLEFSDCQRPIGRNGIPLEQWIGQVVAARQDATPEAKQTAIRSGLQELRQSGTRLAAEITTPPCHYPPEVSRPELITFAEVLGLARQRWHQRLELGLRHSQRTGSAGWSPHAPYSTSLACIEACIELAQQYDRPLAMHVAESPVERELLSSATGPLARTLGELGVWRDEIFPWGNDPFGMLIDRLSKAPRVLLIHGNDLNAAEIERLRPHRHMTVVYCPRTHHFFGYAKHPLEQMLAAGVRVALGTDSRASNPDLSLWHEVQFLLRHRPDLAPKDVLAMATVNGADALGRSDLGRIDVGCCGDLGWMESSARTRNELYEEMGRNPYRWLSGFV